MFVNFFIKRPIFSTVISLVIVLAGIVCIPILPIAQFPEIAPPTVQVTATYTGASADVVEKTVTQPIEEQVNGVEGMTYMTSTSSNDGSSKITVTFDIGYDLNIAAVDVQNRVAIAEPQLPEDVRRYGITTKKQSTNFIMIINLVSPDGTYDDLYLSNYADINIVDVLKRISGIGDVQIFGERKYSMRFWLTPDTLTGLDLTVDDVIDAIRDQNIQVAAGGIGNPPTPQGQAFQYAIQAKGRLTEVEEFKDIIIRTNDDGAVVRVGDVAEVDLGAENYGWFFNLNGKKCAGIGLYQLAGANAVQIAKEARAAMETLKHRFPAGLEYTIAYDTTMFVTESIKEVLITLGLAILLVIGVIYIFLQDWRSTLIPCVTIPVSLIGTFGIMMAFGFSINTLTLFGLVLAIGTVVDDAIVVVENTTRLIETENLSSMEAAMKGMAEVTGPVIATTLVLFAVFVPVAFMPGISGQLYKQFALTIAFSVGISTICALTISPAMCAIILRKKSGEQGKFFSGFNWVFDKSSHAYQELVGSLIKRWKLIVIFFVLLVGLTFAMFRIVPTAFVPDEDQGYFFIIGQGPPGMSLQRTEAVAQKIEQMMMATDGVSDVMTIGGFNMLNQALDSSAVTVIVILKSWDERKTTELSVEYIIGMTNWKLQSFNELVAFSFNPPPIQGLSQTGGFQFELQDLASGDIDTFSEISQRIIDMGAKYPSLTPLSTTFKTDYPQYYVDLDRTKAKTLGISISTIFSTLQSYLGSLYVNDFNKFGRIYRVFIQAKGEYRSDIENLSKLYVRSKDEDLIPLSTLVSIRRIMGPQTISHYNVFRSIEINGANAPGHSSGDAINAMQDIAKEVLPQGYGYEWTGTALQEKLSGGTAPFIFALALAFVFLFLAAQYESWALPIVIMMAVPLAILGALVAQWWRGLYDDIYCQIGLVMLIGLASKNAILIVEFAKDKHEEGATIVEAAIEAAHTRLRPILMTALSFILGVVPLVLATGAGAASRHSLGTAVFGGMIASTFLSLGVVPVFYVVIVGLTERGVHLSDFMLILKATFRKLGSMIRWIIEKNRQWKMKKKQRSFSKEKG
jgi:multidrug efflux pump